jgi:hypothetical protein
MEHELQNGQSVLIEQWAVALACPAKRAVFFNPEGMVLCQPRAKQREGNERCPALGHVLQVSKAPTGRT